MLFENDKELDKELLETYTFERGQIYCNIANMHREEDDILLQLIEDWDTAKTFTTANFAYDSIVDYITARIQQLEDIKTAVVSCQEEFFLNSPYYLPFSD